MGKMLNLLFIVLFITTNVFAVTLDFEDFTGNANFYSFDVDSDGNEDITFTCAVNFNNTGPGPNPQLYSFNRGLMPGNADVRVDFLNQAANRIAFGYAINDDFNSVAPVGTTSTGGVRLKVYDADDNLLGELSNYGKSFAVPDSGGQNSKFAENRLEVNFDGAAAYAIFSMIVTIDATAYFIDNFTGTFGSTEIALIQAATSISSRAEEGFTDDVAQIFDNSGDSDLQSVKAELASQTDALLNKALKRIKGQDKPTLVHVASGATLGHMGTVSSRMSSIESRSSLSGADFTNNFSSAYNKYNYKGYQVSKDNFILGYGSATGLDSYLPWGFWVRGYGSHGDRETTEITSGYKHQTTGLSVGFDYKVNKNLLLGVHGGYSETDVDYVTNDYSDVDSQYYGVYASYNINKIALDMMLTYAHTDYKTVRRINFGAINREAVGDFNGEELAAYAEISYAIALGEKSSIRPLVGFQSSYNLQDAYEETGADSLNLVVNKDRTESYKVSLGAEYSTQLADIENFKLDLLMRGRWLYEMGEAKTAGIASLSGARNDTFIIEGSKIGRHTGVFGTSLMMSFAGDKSVELAYDYTANEDYDNHVVSLGYKVRW